MLITQNSFIKLAEAILLRAMIFAFVFLGLQFTRMFISDSAGTYPYIAMWGTILVSGTAMIILNLLYGEHSVARDINTLIFYAVVFHLIYLPCYYAGLQFAAYHNGAIKIINYLIILRLFYFGSRELLSRISIIGRTKKLFLSRRWFINSYINGLTLTLFFLCAIPLFTLIYVINTDKMRITGISIILFVFFIAIEYANKKKVNRQLLAEQRATVTKTVSDATRARVLQQIEKAKREVVQMREYINILYVFGAVLVLALVVTSYYDSRRDAIFGYATGYIDAKTGKPPRVETDIQKLMNCYKHNGNNNFPRPTDACAETKKFKP